MTRGKMKPPGAGTAGGPRTREDYNSQSPSTVKDNWKASALMLLAAARLKVPELVLAPS